LNKLYREEDKEAGQCVVRDGFQVVVNLALDGDFSMEMSSMQKAEVQEKMRCCAREVVGKVLGKIY